MNYLAHLHLGGEQPEQLLGSLYGDFVKGRLEGRFSPQIEAAIRLHRRIDAFTDSHPLTERARARFPAERRRTAGILLDLFFDHGLARHPAIAQRRLGDLALPNHRHAAAPQRADAAAHDQRQHLSGHLTLPLGETAELRPMINALHTSFLYLNRLAFKQ